MVMAFLAVAVAAIQPETSNPLLQRCGVVHNRLEVGTFKGEQTCKNLTIARDPQAVAVTAERLTDEGNAPEIVEKADSSVKNVVTGKPPSGLLSAAVSLLREQEWIWCTNAYSSSPTAERLLGLHPGGFVLAKTVGRV